MSDHFPLTIRPRRLRRTKGMRDLIAETSVLPSDFIYPLFVKEGIDKPEPISTLLGQKQWDMHGAVSEAKRVFSLGIPAILLFGIPLHKDAKGSSALKENIITDTVQAIKQAVPELVVMTDLCFCEYTDHGHCGVLDHQGDLDNDETLALLARQAVLHARAGVDVIAPSGMLDGMVAVLRKALDDAGYQHVSILSYAVKYASSFYGPFRVAVEGSMTEGDRRSAQMDPRNRREALREAALDVEQGADMLMVKPAHTYLDVIADIADHYPDIPLVAYQVSGEYAMITAASEAGLLSLHDAMEESLIAMKRAGARCIISYYAASFAERFNQS